MPCRRVFFSLGIALSFDGVKVENAWTLHVFYIVEHLHDLADVVAIEWSEIAYIQSFEYVLLFGNQRLNAIVESENDTPTLIVDDILALEAVVESISPLIVSLGGSQFGEIAMQSTDIIID